MDFISMEHEILDFWEKSECFKKLAEKNKDNTPFRFLDGPITANNPMGIHHAWGRSIKDIFLRYKAMKGYSCHYRNGFDTQGLWVEVEVEKELGFKGKKDIEEYGMAEFTNKCVERITRYSKVITEQSKRLGQWMDFENSYFTHTDENITGIWHFLKVCHEKGMIATSDRPMPWCPRCGTSLSEHEMSGSHVEITHTAVYARLPVKNKGFDMLVWTTTPWTMAANTALAVNHALEYASVILPGHERPVVMAKEAAKRLYGSEKIHEIISGNELIGLEYETFFPELPVQQGLAHKIIPWDEVDACEGSGVVHIAPGCGVEDYELGKANSLAQICPVDEAGRFTSEYDFLSGKTAAGAAALIFKGLEREGKLVTTHGYTHSYPVCWRCKTEVLFRLVREWYIKTDGIKAELAEAANGVKWEPAYIGKRMNDWLVNMGDWNISRKRFYGLPLPFYPCTNCGHLTVIGSLEELAMLGGAEAYDLPELHRPWIDGIKIKCPKCQCDVARIPEVGDVWLDAGITPFSTLKYFTDKEYWNSHFPAEWVTEMNEQVRLWFYSLLFMSVTLTGKAPYERVLAYNSVVSEDGSRFHKTGYMINFKEAAEITGADAIRYLFAGAPVSSDVRFGYGLGEEARRKLLSYWNIYTFFMTYASIDNPKIKNSVSENMMDKWLCARASDFVKKAAKAYENYNTPELIREFEVCIDDVSNWYVRASRKRFWGEGMDNDKQNAYNTLYFAIKAITAAIAPVLPFMTEYVWRNMIIKYAEAGESVHLSNFPDASEFDTEILKYASAARDILAVALKLRNESRIKVKQPLKTLYLDEQRKDTAQSFLQIIREELNIKEVIFTNSSSLTEEYLAVNYKTAGKILKNDLQTVKEMLESDMKNCVACYKRGDGVTNYNGGLPAEFFLLMSKPKKNIAFSEGSDSIGFVALDTEISAELKEEGLYRETLRNCQVLRKEAGFAVSDRVKLSFVSDSDYILDIIQKYKNELSRETLSEITNIENPVAEKKIMLDEAWLIIKIL